MLSAKFTWGVTPSKLVPSHRSLVRPHAESPATPGSKGRLPACGSAARLPVQQGPGTATREQESCSGIQKQGFRVSNSFLVSGGAARIDLLHS